MSQYPPQQPGWGQPSQPLSNPSWNPSQYNQPTQGWQQPGPPPGFNQQYPSQPLKPLPHQRAWRWFRSRSRRGKLGLGCLTIVLLFVCSICSISAAAVGSTPTATITPTATATSAAVQQAKQQAATPTFAPVATATATAHPTATAAPSPTATPQPTQAPQPTPKPTQAPQPTPTPKPRTGVNGNPWGYDFNSGNLIYNPPADFCGQYFSCVTTFWTATNGYVAECGNGEYTHSGGVRGACSRDSGVAQTLYSH